MEKINFENLSWAKKIAEKPDKYFEINPLDMNLAQMEFNLQKRLEKEVPEYGDFAPVVERYFSKDPTIDLSEVNIACKHSTESDNKKVRKLILEIGDKIGNKSKYVIAEGEKNKMIEMVNNKNFFLYCKHVILEKVKTKF